ncbi:UNVERIFIED_CONTAM: hypothetical protein K2H54_057000 [Gekko kuhli]
MRRRQRPDFHPESPLYQFTSLSKANKPAQISLVCQRAQRTVGAVRLRGARVRIVADEIYQLNYLVTKLDYTLLWFGIQYSVAPESVNLNVELLDSLHDHSEVSPVVFNGSYKSVSTYPQVV